MKKFRNYSIAVALMFIGLYVMYVGYSGSGATLLLTGLMIASIQLSI